MDLGKNRKPLVSESNKKAPYNKPEHIFVECDIATSSSVGSRMFPIVDHFSYNMDDAGVFEYRPRPLNWVKCAYRPQGDTVTMRMREENGASITINIDDTPEIICELKFRSSYIL